MVPMAHDSSVTGPSFALHLNLSESPAQAQTNALGPRQTLTGPATDSVAGTYAWIPVNIPADATSLSFNFTFHGLASDESLTVGVNEMQLIALQSQFVEDGILLNSGDLDVSPWEGQTVELFFGLNSDGTSDGSVSVDSLEFDTVPEPSSVLLPMVFIALAMNFCGRSMRRRSEPYRLHV